jgi:beta-lactamase class A
MLTVILTTGVVVILSLPGGVAGRRGASNAAAGLAQGPPAAGNGTELFVAFPPAPQSSEHRTSITHIPGVPTPEAMRSAWRYARNRGGIVSFSAVDSQGRLRSREGARAFPAASVVKAMVLAAELNRLARSGTPLDDNTASTLEAMITYSDNAAADLIFARVGDAGLEAIAKRAGMEGFEISGYWGNAQITADDMARFFADLGGMFEPRHRDYGRELLASVISSQSWGIPVAAGNDWAVRFKGGWLPDKALVHQAAELRGGGLGLSLAILTDEQPSFDYGIETIEGIAARLLD